MISNTDASLDRTSVILVAVMCGILVVGFVTLTIAGVDTTAYVIFCAGPLMTTLVGAVLSHKVAGVAATVKVVEAQTNGIATAARESLETHLDAQDRTAAIVAQDAEKRAQRPNLGAPGWP